jgi:RNA ligase (TIGR02306 family)
MRKLVSIRIVKEIKEHPNADALEIAVVDGWQCIVKKDEFKVGDFAVYFEIDSFLPIREEFEFLRKSCYKKMGDQEGFRLKTMKLRGELSQGLLLPISTMESFDIIGKHYEEGEDVTDVLKVQKYDPPIPASLSGEILGQFPGFIPKTDQERIQNLYDDYQKYKDTEFEASIKLDGSSMTVFCIDEKFKDKERTSYKNRDIGVCSRNLELKEKEGNTLWDVFNAFKERFAEYCIDSNRNLALQGELMGPGIQGNREKLHKHGFYLYDIFCIDEGKYLSPEERTQIAKELNLEVCPVIQNVKILQKSLHEILEYAEGRSINHNIREGIVFKGYSGNEYISFKAISNKFLLKEK